ncbi:hypothetical protein GGR51DRAFT_537386 [Nemania sp. FL0031]|nr:hypothetical protein GGR51DRAFT_537386 [Nemania sp. FL0031]
MSFMLALQSLVFYLVSCAPCHQAAHQHQLRQQAKKQRDAKERNGVNTEGYQQPEPFSTNPYWSEEIRMGPHLDRKKHKTPVHQGPSTSTGGGLVRVGANGNGLVGSTTTAPKSTAVPPTGPDTTKTIDTTDTTTVSITKENEKPNAPSVGPRDDGASANNAVAAVVENGKYRLSPQMATTLPHDWNHKRYQREDEELWGPRTGHKLMDAIKHAGSSAGRFIESSLGKDIKLHSDDEDEDSHYFVPVNPPVNDYHPPIVRRPPFQGSIRWMVQPPPSAKIMEGKVPVRSPSDDKIIDGIPINRHTVSRGSSVSNLSRHTTASGAPATLAELV